MLGAWMVACHRASIDEVLTLFSIVLTGTFHGSTNFELMRNNIIIIIMRQYSKRVMVVSNNATNYRMHQTSLASQGV